MDLLASFIGLIPMGIAILWFFELEGKAEEKDCAPGLCGCLFLIFAGASLTGTLKSVFSHSLDIYKFCFFVISAVLSGICFFIWKRS